MGLNQFADVSVDEFKEKYIYGYKTPVLKGSSCKPFTTYPNKEDPPSYDWTENHVVNPIRDQGQCGSCWAFATTANAESVWAISKGRLYDLSEQFLVDCASGIGYFNQGCNGGQPDSALKYMIHNGQYLESVYPYTATTDKCQTYASHIDIKFSSCYDVTPNNHAILQAAVRQNPVVIAIEADTRYFQFYSSGILTDSIKCGTDLDHAVEIVGYGTENGIDYWKVRNSWGESWGENGYVKIEKSSSTNDPGVCGVAMEPSFIHI
jgi:C1A family cysteine protease